MVVYLHRYNNPKFYSSALDPIVDVLSWVKGLKSRNYLRDTIRAQHDVSGWTANELNQRISVSSSHISIACDYLEQGLNGPENVSFLPLYYAFLNLAKVYVALGSRFSQLPKQRYHGVTYDSSKNVSDLMKNQIKIGVSGAIPLFYQTVTGNSVPNDFAITMGQIYPYISEISVEYRMATGKAGLLRPAYVEALDEGEHWRVRCSLTEGYDDAPHINERKYLPTISGCHPGLRRVTKNSDDFYSNKVPMDNGQPPMSQLRRTFCGFTMFSLVSVPPPYTYQNGEMIPVMLPICTNGIQMFQELPILLAFFHISSVVRYHPELHQSLMASKYLPLLLALQRHGTYNFLMLFWSFIRQESVYLTR